MTSILDKTIALLAVKDPLSYQQVQAMNDTALSESNEGYVAFTDVEEAIREIEATGDSAFNPDSLEDEYYDASNIRDWFTDADGSEPVISPFANRD